MESASRHPPQEPRLSLFSFFEERQTGAFVLGHDIAFGKGIHSTCTGGGSEIVKGDGRSATESLLATMKVVRFSVFLAGAAELHKRFLLWLCDRTGR